MSDLEVHIVESLTDSDVSQRRTEGEMLAQSLHLAGIRSTYAVAKTRAEFESAVSSVASQYVPADFAVLHLSCHGDEAGVRLTSGETVSWYELRSMLVKVNRAHSGRLLVCMSSCRGLFAAGMALNPNDLPFHSVVGPVSNVRFQDAAVGFVVFYHQLCNHASIERAVEIMVLASGEDQFGVVEGEATRQAILEAIANIQDGA